LLELEQLLSDLIKKIPDEQSRYQDRLDCALYIGDSRRLLRDDRFSGAQLRQQRIVLAYFLRKKLYGPRKWKQARFDTANKHSVAETSVSTFATRWGTMVRARMEYAIESRLIRSMKTSPSAAVRRQRILEAKLRDLEDPSEWSDEC